MHAKVKLLRIATKPVSINLLIRNQLQFMGNHGFEVFTASAAGKEVAEFTQREGVVHYEVPFTRSITPFQDFYCLLRLIRIIQTTKPLIVHTHTPKAGLLGMIAAWICRVPVRVHTVAGLPLMEARGLKRWVLKLTERVTYFCAHKVYPNSFGLLEFIREEFHLNYMSAEGLGKQKTILKNKFKVIGNGSSNGIDTSFFSTSTSLKKEAEELRQKWGIPKNVLVFGFIGRIVRDKGIVELVEAFRKISERMDARLLLVGEFEQDLDPLPQSILDFLKNDSRVIAPGFQLDVRPWFRVMDVFTFPSYREGFPNAVMQACSLEVPCIVSNINGCNELIKHQVNGLIVLPKDSYSLFEAMKLMADNRENRTEYARKSRSHVVANFEQKVLWEQLLLEYKELLKTQCAYEWPKNN